MFSLIEKLKKTKGLIAFLCCIVVTSTFAVGPITPPPFTGGDVNNPIGIAAGSVSAPSLYRTGDTNTGIYFPSADQIAATAGGVQVWGGTATAFSTGLPFLVSSNSAGYSGYFLNSYTSGAWSSPILSSGGFTGGTGSLFQCLMDGTTVKFDVTYDGKLNVNGASTNGTGVTIRGSGTTTNHALSVETSGNTEKAYIQDNGQGFFGGVCEIGTPGYASAPTYFCINASGSNTAAGYAMQGNGTDLYLNASSSLIMQTQSNTRFTLSHLFNQSSGTAALFNLAHTSGQSGTAGYDFLQLNITQSSTGSGTKNIINGKVDGASKFAVSNTGNVTATAYYYSATVFDSAGSGSPESVVTAAVGSTYRRTDGGAGTSFYVKESGSGNTGWVAK